MNIAPETTAAKETLTLSLVSHTNVGKTTLARTLLRRDVGEVFDQAHVTEVSEAHTMVESDTARLELWDTPGFGDTARLLRRLKSHRNPVGWFIKQVWDRMADRPLWCSQQAVKNVKQHADVVLYLVNASEDPEGAGYVDVEMQILDWIGRPVLVLLNQTGPPVPPGEEEDDVGRWRRHLVHHRVVRDVISLDAFTRCWVQEGELLRRLRGALLPHQQRVLDQVWRAWRDQNIEVFRRAMEVIAEHLEQTACDRERLSEERRGKDADRKRAMTQLAARLVVSTRRTMERLIEIHGLEGASLADFATELSDFRLPDVRLDPVRAGVLGGVVGGALTGLAADIAAGGMTLGGGLIAGSILGALGSAGLARGYRLLRGGSEAEISWSPEFLTRLAKENLLRYLAVAHYGRGRGEYHDAERPDFWLAAVDAEIARRETALTSAFVRAEVGGEERRGTIRRTLEEELAQTTQAILLDFYPQAEPFV